MLKGILDCLKKGYACSYDELARQLDTSSENIMAGIEYLAQQGYLKQVQTQPICGGGCKGCGSCGEKENSKPIFWERI